MRDDVLIGLAGMVFALMVAEAIRASRNERAQRAQGGVEPAGDVYSVMQVAYPLAFLAMFAEGVVRAGTPWPAAVAAGAAVFVFGKALKWWAIVTLGRFWTFRVIIVPGAPLVRTGPYRILRHPNYLGVLGELAGVGLMTGAIVAGPLATAAFGALMLRRIAIEDRALGREPRPSAAARRGV